jgi:hypothetical protein
MAVHDGGGFVNGRQVAGSFPFSPALLVFDRRVGR